MPQHLRTPLRRGGFDALDETIIALALAPELDPVLAQALTALTVGLGTPYPTAALIGDLVGAHGTQRVELAVRLCDAGPLARLGLLHVMSPLCPGGVPRGPSLVATCAPSAGLLRWTFGVTRLDPALFPRVRDDLLAPQHPPDARVAEALTSVLSDPVPSLISLVGGRPGDAQATALYAAARSGRVVLSTTADALVDASLAARVATESLLRDAVVVVTGDTTTVPPSRWETLATVVVVGSHPVLGDHTSRLVSSLTLERPASTSLGGHLVDVLRDHGLSVSAPEARRIGGWRHLRHEDIGHLVATLSARAAGRGPTDDALAVTADDLSDVAVRVVGNDLARLATPLETSRDWSQLVLPAPLRRELTALVEQAASRAAVLDECGFGDLPGQPRGVTAVFAGPSGSGKTLASRLVAGDLGLPLYAVDLAATVSKYIGETERNLDALFAAAEKTDAVLLFDEAESLFGKRSEVQDARDRYANLEISFLLQRMERYEGVAILATNLLGHFDDAFARRLSFCLHFPYPDEAQRARIWRAVWPPQVELDDAIDFDEIAARHPFSGGHIRNVALASTHLAHGRLGVVDTTCLLEAIDREYAKLGQLPDVVPEPVP
ncbi:ATP-binding protein [Ornithinimicrobium pekingense]|uniref:ATPase n=1 Tax=Ornithinimicrobium pekingense TaxID=384677 RepID=A0ABQ2F5C2_9MICO|nr:ATP-binding protein [Ornithinimicrobium pekingense]GGK63375.1 ATPase [Ornithinimicrobium pekingense]